MIEIPLLSYVSLFTAPELGCCLGCFIYYSYDYLKYRIFTHYNKRVKVSYKLGDRTYLNSNVQNLNSFRRGIVLKYVINDEVYMDIKEVDKVNYLHKYNNLTNEDNENWYLYNYINESDELVAYYKLEDFKYTFI